MLEYMWAIYHSGRLVTLVGIQLWRSPKSKVPNQKLKYRISSWFRLIFFLITDTMTTYIMYSAQYLKMLSAPLHIHLYSLFYTISFHQACHPLLSSQYWLNFPSKSISYKDMKPAIHTNLSLLWISIFFFLNIHLKHNHCSPFHTLLYSHIISFLSFTSQGNS